MAERSPYIPLKDRLISESPRPHVIAFDQNHIDSVRESLNSLEAEGITIKASFVDYESPEEEKRMIASMGLLTGQTPVIAYANPAEIERFWLRFNEIPKKQRVDSISLNTNLNVSDRIIHVLKTPFGWLRRINKNRHAA